MEIWLACVWTVVVPCVADSLACLLYSLFWAGVCFPCYQSSAAGLLPDYLFISWGLGCCYADVLLFLSLLVSVTFFGLVSGKLTLSLNLGTLVPPGTSEARCPLVPDGTLTILAGYSYLIGAVCWHPSCALEFWLSPCCLVPFSCLYWFLIIELLLHYLAMALSVVWFGCWFASLGYVDWCGCLIDCWYPIYCLGDVSFWLPLLTDAFTGTIWAGTSPSPLSLCCTAADLSEFQCCHWLKFDLHVLFRVDLTVMLWFGLIWGCLCQFWLVWYGCPLTSLLWPICCFCGWLPTPLPLSEFGLCWL
jgi:hypothetical protein